MVPQRRHSCKDVRLDVPAEPALPEDMSAAGMATWNCPEQLPHCSITGAPPDVAEKSFCALQKGHCARAVCTSAGRAPKLELPAWPPPPPSVAISSMTMRRAKASSSISCCCLEVGARASPPGGCCAGVLAADFWRAGKLETEAVAAEDEAADGEDGVELSLEYCDEALLLPTELESLRCFEGEFFDVEVPIPSVQSTHTFARPAANITRHRPTQCPEARMQAA